MQNFDQKLQSLLSRLKSDKGVDGDLPSVEEIRGDYNTAINFFNKTIKPLYKDRTYSDFQEDFGTPTIKDRRTGINYIDSYNTSKEYAPKYDFPIPTGSPKPDIRQEPLIDKAERGFKVLYSDVANSFVNASYGVLDIYESSIVAPLTALSLGDKVSESNLKNIRISLERSKKELQSSLRSDVSQKERETFFEQAGITGEVLSALASQASMFVGGGATGVLKVGSAAAKLATGAKVAGSIGFALGVQNGLDAINSSESGRKLPEKYKTIYAGIVGMVEMITEAIPFKAIFGNMVSKKLINPIIDKTISNIFSKGIKEITPEIFEQEASIVSKKLLNRVTKVGGNVAKAMSEEFPSEFISSASNDILNKYINKESGQKIFDDKSWGDILHDATRNGYLGAMAAGGLSGLLSVGSPKVNNHIIQTLTENKSSDGSFDVGRQKLLDEYVQTQQELGKDTSVEQLDNVINGYIDRLNKTPKDLTPIQQQAVLELSDEKDSALQKKEALEKDKEGLDVPFQNNIQQQIDAITTNIDNLDSQIGELPSMDDSEIYKLLNEISISESLLEKGKSINVNQQGNETEIRNEETGTQGNENVANAVQVSGEKGGENVNKQVEEKLPIVEQTAIPKAEQQTEGTIPLIQQEDGKERNKKGRKENVLTATTQEDISASQVENTSGVKNYEIVDSPIVGIKFKQYTNFVPEKKEDIDKDALYYFKGSSIESIPSLIRDKARKGREGYIEVKGKKINTDEWRASIHGDELFDYFNKQEVKSVKKENNAIQEQITSKSVLREKGQGLELRPMDEGNKKSEVIAEQGKAVKEEVSKELKLDENKKQEEIKINGEKKTIKEGDNVIVSHAGNDIEGVIVKDKDGNLQVEQKYSYRGNQKTKYSLDAIKEFVEEQTKDIAKDQVKEPTKSKKIADNVRKGKINKKGNVYANTPFSLAWDSALELIAQSIEKGGDVLTAINKGIEAFKKSEWYKSSTKEDREVETANLEHELKIRYADSLLDNIYDEKNLLSEDIKKEQFDRLKNIIENATTKEISYKEYETLIKRNPKTFSSLGNFVKKLDIKESKIDIRLDFENNKKNLISDISNTLKDNSKNINTKNISELLKLTENAKNDNDLIKISNKYNGVKREIIFEGYKKEVKDNLKQILKTAAFTDAKNADISNKDVLKIINTIDNINNEKSLIDASIKLDGFKKKIADRLDFESTKKNLINEISITLKKGDKNIGTKNISILVKRIEGAKSSNDLINISDKFNDVLNEIKLDTYKKELKDNLKQILKTAAFTDAKNIDISTDDILKLTNSIDSIKNEKSLIYASIELDNFKKSIINRDNLNKAKKELIDNLKDLRSTLKESIVAFDKVNKLYGNVNRLPKLIESISNIRDEKSFEKAKDESNKYMQDFIFITKQRYVEQLGKSLTRKIKSAKIDNAALKELNRLNPFKLNNEEIDTITDMLGTVKAQLYGKKEGLIPNEDILSFVDKVKERLKEEQAEKVKEEVKAKTKEKEPEDLTILNANINALKEDLKVNSDKYSDRLKEILKTILAIDINNIDNKKEFSLLLANVVANKEVQGLGKYISRDKANKIVSFTKNFVEGKKLGLSVGSKFTSQALQIKNIFNDPKRGAAFANMIGIAKINNAEALSIKAREEAIKNIDNALKRNGFENGIDDRTTGMSFTAGILADLRRNSSQKGYFENVKVLIEDSISVLKNGNDSEQRKSDAIATYYNKYAKDAINADEVYDNIRKESLLKNENGKDAKGAIIMYQTILPFFDKNFPDSNIESQLYQNKKLVESENYKPRRYEDTSTTNKNKEETKDRDISGMASDIYSDYNVSTSTSGTMKEENMPRKISNGDRVLNLDILETSLDAIQEQVYDIESLEDRNALHELFQNNEMRNEMRGLLGGQWNVLGIEGTRNYDLLENGIISAVKSHLGIYNTKEDRDILHAVGTIAANYARSVLYTPKQVVLQTLPLFLGSTVNTLPTFKGDYFAAVRIAYNIASNKDSEVLRNSPILVRSASELIINSRVKTKQLNADFDSEIKKRIKGGINTLNIPNEWLAKKTIDSPDNLIARVSWIMYYLEYKKRNGETNLGKDWNVEPIDKGASSYAEMMVSNTQGVNSQSNAPEFWKDKGNWATFGKSALFMFSGFSMNIAANMKSDIRILATGSKDQKASASLRLMASMAETTVYTFARKALLLIGAGAIDTVKDLFYGDDEKENDKLSEKLDELLSIDGMEKLIFEGLANQLLFDGLGSGVSSVLGKAVNLLSDGKITIGGYYDKNTKYDSELMDFINDMPGAIGSALDGGYYTYKAMQYAFVGETSGEYPINHGRYMQKVYNDIPTRDRILASVLLGAEIGSTVGAVPAFLRNNFRNELRKTFKDNEAVKRRERDEKNKGAEKGGIIENPDYENK